MKQCKGCSKVKPVDDFYRKPRYSQFPDSAAGRSHKCRICTKVDTKAYREANEEKARNADTNSRLKRSYGIDLNEYNQMFAEQNGCCKGCDRHQTELTRKLCVDHDHVTGVVRGLLCVPCNLTLGYVRDNINVLENLKQYLTNHSALAAQNSNILALKPVEKVG